MRFRTLLQTIATVSASALIALLLLTPSIAQDVNLTSKSTGIPSSAKHRADQARVTVRAVSSSSSAASALLSIADQSGFSKHHRILASAILSTIPSPCRTYLKNFYITYDGSTQRGLGGKTTIIIDGSVGDEEFTGLLVHECGHVTHGNLLGSRTAGASGFKDGQDVFSADSPAAQFFAISWMTERVLRENVHAEDFVSGYARSDAFEDFAETFTAYVLHRDMLEERAAGNAAIAAKLRWMETYLPLTEDALGQSLFAWKGSVPWDVTKLPFATKSELAASL